MNTTANHATQLTRRTLLKAVAATGGGFALGFHLPALAQSLATAHDFNAWIAVASDGAVTIQVSQAEMGQGIHTTFPAIVADEMDADWSRVSLEMTPHDLAFANPVSGMMFTGNAESTRTFWPVIRRAGAAVRAMMKEAAARRWAVPSSSLTTSNNIVSHPSSGRQASYGELAAEAARFAAPQDPPLKKPEDWTLLRTSLPRRDLADKVTGAPIFGLDAAVPGQVIAAMRHADTPNGVVARINRNSVMDIPGVLDVVEIPGAVAVIATSTWPALKGAAVLDVTFTPGERDDFSSESLSALYDAAMDGDRWSEVETRGDPSDLTSDSVPDDLVTEDYSSAWQAHMALEPMNCIAVVEGDRAHIIAPTQGQTMVVVRVAEALGVPEENVTVERTFLGGGFGRRLIADYAVEAALVSRAVGKPVQIVWSRTEDVRHDHYRPEARNRLSAIMGSDGLPAAVDQKIVSPTILSAVIPKPPTHWVYPDVDPSCCEGASAEGLIYGLGAYRLRAHMLDVPVPTMVWRTTGYGPNVFALESFIDELAHRAEIDPYDYRLALLRRGEETERAVAVLEMLRDRAAQDRPAGSSQGIALSHCFETYIAQAVDLTIDDNGVMEILRVTTVLDGGYVLDPNITRANIEGGIVWGLGQALTSEITFDSGRVRESNFHDFQILTGAEAPETQLFYIDSGASPGGLGEVGPVPTAPALANAIFAASGRRFRTLPLSRHGIITRYRGQYARPDASILGGRA